MKLPADMTEEEMKAVLIDIRKEYLPDASFEFISSLWRDDLVVLFDLIATKDSKEQEKKWKNIEQKLHSSRASIHMILQKIQMVKIQLKEKKDQSDDTQSLEDIENKF